MVLHYKESIALQESMIKDYSLNFSFSGIDSLDDKLNYLTTTYDFPVIDNTYGELVSSGQFYLISDKDLNSEIISYYLYCESNNNDIDNDLNNIFYKHIYIAINKYSQATLYDKTTLKEDKALIDIDPSLTLYIRNKLNEPAAKLELMNAIKTKLFIQEDFLDVVNTTLIYNDELIKEIHNYLGISLEDLNSED